MNCTTPRDSASTAINTVVANNGRPSVLILREKPILTTCASNALKKSNAQTGIKTLHLKVRAEHKGSRYFIAL